LQQQGRKRIRGNADFFQKKVLTLTATRSLKEKFGIDCSELPEEFEVRMFLIYLRNIRRTFRDWRPNLFNSSTTEKRTEIGHLWRS
jgi:hypothetical protein